MKKGILILLLLAAAGWGVWYFFIREKTVGEKFDATTRKVEKSVNDAVKKVTK